jgi:hypothetical protein
LSAAAFSSSVCTTAGAAGRDIITCCIGGPAVGPCGNPHMGGGEEIGKPGGEEENVKESGGGGPGNGLENPGGGGEPWRVANKSADAGQ